MTLIDTKDLPRCIHRHSPITHPYCFGNDHQPKKGEWWEGQKIGFLDIETTNLKAPFGIVLCWYIKPEGSYDYQSCCILPDDVNNVGIRDRGVMERFAEVLARHDYDTLITYYGTRFDIPFARSRAMKHGIDFPVYGETNHLDLYFATRSKLKLHSNRLEVACDFFGIKGKTPLKPEVWERAQCGNAEALQEVLVHNKGDVDILEQLYYKLRPFIRFTKRSL